MKKPSYTPDFMKFWMVYPQIFSSSKHKWVREGKSNAAVVWEYMNAEDKAHAMYAVQFEKRGQYQLFAAKWLAERRYDDVDMPEEKGEQLPRRMTNSLKIGDTKTVNLSNERNRQMGLLSERAKGNE